MTTGSSGISERISKRQYLSARQCAKRLWLEKFRPELASPPTPDEQYRRDQGIEVGGLAQRLFHEGRHVSGERQVEAHLARTREALTERRPLFEAAFATDRAYARADILVPSGATAWQLIEVKSTTGVYTGKRRPRLEPRFADDVAFQLFVVEHAGLEIESVSLLHLNSEYRRGAEIGPERLFTRVDVTAEARSWQRGIQRGIADAQALLASGDAPEIPIGAQCERPYACPFMSHCWTDVPEDSVHTLYNGRELVHRLWSAGVRRLTEIPDDVKVSPVQAVQIAATRAGQPHVDAAAIGSYLAGLRFPLYFLDFETLQTAVPLYPAARPWQQIPFQFSLHALAAPDAEPVHHEFLAAGGNDPRPALLEALAPVLGERGSIVSYNAPFEHRRLEEMASEFPVHAGWISNALRRFKGADMLAPFRRFSYYDPRQRGSASIKRVLPVLTDISYAHLPIANGAVAAAEYLRIAQREPDAADARIVRANLLRYCELDTLALVAVYRRLRQLVAGGSERA